MKPRAASGVVPVSDSTFETGYIQSQDGTRLFYRCLPKQDAKATLLFVHGFGEHCGRYEHVMRWFHDQGFDVGAFDYRGHGKADGTRAHCDRFDRYLDDMDAFLRFMMDRSGDDRKLYIVGHSHGGLVATAYILNQPEGIDGLVLSAPFFGVKLKVPALKAAAGTVMSRVWPTLALPTGIPAAHLSTDPEVGRQYEADPLVGSTATSRWFTEHTARQELMLKSADKLRLPLLMLLPGSDKIVDAEVSQNFLAAVGSTDKEMQWYDEMYHEIFNEVRKEDVFNDLLTWLRKHV
ncbi:MAG: alpha-beta hydrolase superfamily lysophospholipase [Myxococcota bacterium]|jgi:alpha-beta hydrolase superfamily lysophospholipase